MVQGKIVEPIELNKIDIISNNEPDDILICSASPEERCLGTIQRLGVNYRAKCIFILRYSNHDDKKREEHLKQMRENLNGRGEIKEFVIDEKRPIPMINKITESINEYISNREHPKITIDISTIIKWHLLIFLKALGLNNIFNNIRFLYTEPEDYITELFQPLSFGIHEIFPIPTYYGNYDFSKESLLVLLLGYEGDRAVALLEEFDPADCLLLVPKPAYHLEWEGRTEEMNKEIINIIGRSKIKYIDSRNPIRVANQIKGILSEPEYLKYNHVISPLGTKPQILGLYLYLATNPPNTVLNYGAPLRHNEQFYSHGIGRSWMLPVKN